MVALRVLLGLCLLLSFSQLGNAQGTCVKWSGFPLVCQEFGLKPGDWVYVPYWLNNGLEAEQLVNGMDDMEAIAVDRSTSAQLLAPDLGICADEGMQMVCMGYLRPCVMVNGQPVAIPQQTCRSVCQHFVDKCTEIATAINLPPGVGLMLPKNQTWATWSCDMPDDAPLNIAFFEAENYTFTAPLALNTSQEVSGVAQCLANERQKGLGTTCEEPLVKNEDSQCVFECPLPSLTEKQYDTLEIMQAVFGWLSWGGSFILVISYLGHPRLRAFPSNLILMTAASAHVASLAFILPTFVGTEEVWCDGGTDFLPRITITQQSAGAKQNPADAVAIVFDVDNLLVKGPWCSLQGAILQFGFLSGTFWWAIVVFNIMSEVVLPGMTEKYRRVKPIIYHIVAWSLPAIFTIIPLAADRIAFPNGGSFCFLSYEDSNAYQLAFWFIPIGLLLLAGTICFILSLCRLLPMFCKTQERRTRVKLAGVYTRLLLFVLVQLCVYLFIFSYTVVTESNKEQINEGYEDYYSCLLFLPYPYYPADSCSLDLSTTNYPLVILRALGFSALGLSLFVNFISFNILKFWREMIRAMAPQEGASLGEWPKSVISRMKEVVEKGASESSGTGSSRRSGKNRKNSNTTMVMTIKNEEEEDEI
ncbi:Frizzled-10 [Balamuthia mandrillaris]